MVASLFSAVKGKFFGLNVAVRHGKIMVRDLCGSAARIFADIRQYRRLPVNSTHGQLVSRSSRHRSTRHMPVFSHSQLVTRSSRHTVISSHGQLVTQSTRHKRITVQILILLVITIHFITC